MPTTSSAESSVKPRDQIARELTDIMARLLHYQERGEPDVGNMSCTEIVAETARVPRAVTERYRNEPRFRAQVTRAVAEILLVIP